MGEHRPLGRPSPETLAARAEHQRRTALYADTARRDGAPPPPFPNAGQRWRHRHSGEVLTVLGRRLHAWLLAGSFDAETGAAVDVVEVSLDEHATTYAYVDCNHDTYCCSSHAVHVSPHRGCALR